MLLDDILVNHALESRFCSILEMVWERLCGYSHWFHIGIDIHFHLVIFQSPQTGKILWEFGKGFLKVLDLSIMSMGWNVPGFLLKTIIPSFNDAVPDKIGSQFPDTTCQTTGMVVDPNVTLHRASP